MYNPQHLTAPNKHNAAANKAKTCESIAPLVTNILNPGIELPAKPIKPPNNPNPEPIKVRMHNTVKNVGLCGVEFVSNVSDISNKF